MRKSNLRRVRLESPRRPPLHPTHWLISTQANAINYGLIEPSDFLDPLDSADFEWQPLCPAGYCAGQGLAEDRCDCGVCGSFGGCGWSCDPGAGGENVPTGNDPADFKICDLVSDNSSGYEVNYTRYMGDKYRWQRSMDNEELRSMAEQDCVAYPQASWPASPNYFQDKRFPGMDPLVCVDDAAGKAVCSVLAGGSIPVYPAFRFFDHVCNMCDRDDITSHDAYGDWRDLFAFTLDDDGDVVETCKSTLPPHKPKGLTFQGGILVGWRVGGGIFHEQPQLMTSATSRQWDDLTWLGWTLALEDYGRYSSLAVCPLHDAGPLLVAFSLFNDDRGEVKLNANQYRMNASEWVCNTAWVRDDVFDRLAADVASAPVPPQFDYYKCTPAPDEAREEAIGIAMGGGGFVFLVVAFLLVHVFVRALDKMGRVEFRNGRFIPPGAIDEWLEHEAVTSIMREKASEAKRPGTSSIPLPTIADVSLST